MIKCLHCSSLSPFPLTYCKQCNVSIEKVNGFLAFSSNSAIDGVCFNIDSFETLAYVEEGNFWFNARNKLLIWLIEKFGGHFNSFLEIGCGTGFVLQGIRKHFPSAKLYGSELFVQGLEHAAKRIPSATFMQMNACDLPFVNEFDCIGLFDVLEHIKEDELVLSNIFNALKENGLLFISVPQHQWLWSHVDELACHVQRYSEQDLQQKLAKVGFETIFSSSFVCLLLPAMYISRFLQSKKNTSLKRELASPRMLNFVLEQILNFEVFLIKKGIRFPMGGSRVIVARKKSI
jgi:SAM-dependent methyltransferase